MCGETIEIDGRCTEYGEDGMTLVAHACHRYLPCLPVRGTRYGVGAFPCHVTYALLHTRYYIRIITYALLRTYYLLRTLG